MLEIATFILGPVETNTYLIADAETKEAVVIDPAWDGQRIVAEAGRRGWRIAQVWATHAHFDHMAGTVGIFQAMNTSLPIALHPEDRILWQMQGGAMLFGIRIEAAPEPTIALTHGQILELGRYTFEVRHTPGHTPGHVVFYCQAEKIAFCGDVIFAGSIGRTDLPGGDYATLIHSIRTQIISLPEDTLLLSGHGPDTTVGTERRTNPFLVG